MQWNIKRWLATLITASAALLSACGGGGSSEHETLDVVRLAKSNANLSVLAEAIDAAGLATTLSAAGPYTVFAPTNQAFLDLLAELKMSKADLLANKDFLTSVLTYHVLGSKVVSSAVPLGQPITTVQKGFFKAETLGRSLTITDGRNRFSNVVTADVVAQNGVVHLIDKVLLPANKNVLQTAIALSTEAQPEFSILVEAVVAADLVTTLSGDGPFTVFAPNNAAFAALLTELGTTKAALLADKPLLTKVLTYHVVPGLVLKAQVPVGSPITTVQKDTFTVNAALAITDQRARSAKITATDVLASNGVIHAIDKVILPKP